jgi:hypothetical protein
MRSCDWLSMAAVCGLVATTPALYRKGRTAAVA